MHDNPQPLRRPLPHPLPIGEPVPDPTPRARPDQRALEGRTVTLRPLDPERDADSLFRASHGSPGAEELWTYMAAGPFADATALGNWYRETGAAGDPLFYTVADRASGSPLGVVSILALRPAHGALELGHIWIALAAQGTEVNSEASLLLLHEAFERLGYRRVEWKCDALNARSRAAALRLGFRFEGVFRQHLIVRGRNRDTAWYALLDVEWPAVRGALERWLAWDDAVGPRPPLASLRDD